jgi:hypothetical protein
MAGTSYFWTASHSSVTIIMLSSSLYPIKINPKLTYTDGTSWKLKADGRDEAVIKAICYCQ